MSPSPIHSVRQGEGLLNFDGFPASAAPAGETARAMSAVSAMIDDRCIVSSRFEGTIIRTQPLRATTVGRLFRRRHAQDAAGRVVGEQIDRAVGPLPHVADAFVQA